MPFDPFIQQIVERKRWEALNGGKLKEPETVLEWAMRYRRIDDQPFSLERHHPLKEIYADEWPRIVIMKPAQRGVSEYAICLACFALDVGAKRWVADRSKSGLNVGYIFPVKGDLNEFSKERISSLKEESTHLATMFSGQDEFDALGFKQVGKSYFYLRGGSSERGLLSFPADLLIFDEYDRLDRRAVALARRRMNASPVKREVAISTPTLPGHGISAAYLASDQRIYQSECPHCGAWNTYDFFRDVYCDDVPYSDSDDQTGWHAWSQERAGISTVTLRCPSCKGVIDDEARCKPGRWHIQNPEFTRVHGYHVPWWPFPFVDLPGLVNEALSEAVEDIEELHRSDLGMPYGSGGGSVTEEMLRQCSALMPESGMPKGPWRDTTMGVDIGARLHYRVSSIGPDGLVYVRAMGSVQDWGGLDTLMLRYQVRNCCVDAEPELHDAVEFCQRWKGRAKRGFEQTRTTALQGKTLNEKKDTFDIQINRTMAMDGVLAQIANAREVWPPEVLRDPEVLSHMQAPVRVKTKDGSGQEHYTWVHSSPDHFFHACVFDYVARRTLPKASSFAPAVAGERPLLSAYQQVSGGGREPRPVMAGSGVPMSAVEFANALRQERPLF